MLSHIVCYIPSFGATREMIQEQWTLNKTLSFLRKKGFLTKRGDLSRFISFDANHLLFVDHESWIEIEFKSFPLDSMFSIEFYNIILY